MFLADEDKALIPENMSNECIAQCWFRFLHIYSNPVDLTHTTIIGGTEPFIFTHNNSLVDASNHPCLQQLPEIFHKAMRGVALLVDAFLGKKKVYYHSIYSIRESSI